MTEVKLKLNSLQGGNIRLSKRVKLLLMALLIASVVSAAKAQSNETRSGLGALKTQTGQVGLKIIEADSASVRNQSFEPAAVPVKGKLEGTWLITGTLSDSPPGFPFKSLLTFTPGRSDTEGPLIRTNNIDLIAPLSGTTGQGVWQKISQQSFVATTQAFLFDASNGFLPAGMVTTRDAITLGNEELLTITSHIEIFDLDGNVLFTFEATGRGARIRVQALPAP